MMERVLNHMERQGFAVQSIIPVDNRIEAKAEPEVLLAGKKLVHERELARPATAPAVTDANIDSVYGRDHR